MAVCGIADHQASCVKRGEEGVAVAVEFEVDVLGAGFMTVSVGEVRGKVSESQFDIPDVVGVGGFFVPVEEVVAVDGD